VEDGSSPTGEAYLTAVSVAYLGSGGHSHPSQNRALQVKPIPLPNRSGRRGKMQLWKRRGDDQTSYPIVSEVDGRAYRVTRDRRRKVERRTLPLRGVGFEKGCKDRTAIR
jgi:hypothetical protein